MILQGRYAFDKISPRRKTHRRVVGVVKVVKVVEVVEAGNGATSSPIPAQRDSYGVGTRPSVVEAFVYNPVVFLAGAFVGVMELSVTDEESEISRWLRRNRPFITND
jgi:hypothetical protein